MKKSKKMLSNNITKAIFIALLTMGFVSCSDSSNQVWAPQPISESEIVAFQKGYEVSMNGILNTYINEGDVTTAVKNHIEKHYGFDEGKVLFKAAQHDETPFRSTFEGLSSYLIGNNSSFPKDEGFAIQGWNKIDWRNLGIINDESIAIAMGIAIMKDGKGNQLKQNYTMGFKKNDEGELKLIAHKISEVCQ